MSYNEFSSTWQRSSLMFYSCSIRRLNQSKIVIPLGPIGVYRSLTTKELPMVVMLVQASSKID